MSEVDLKIPKGFRDFLPEDAKKRRYLYDFFIKSFTTFGFDPIETPAIEYTEILLNKYGPSVDRLIYSFKDRGGRDLSLKYDQTVPVTRVLAMYKDALPMPFRRYQIQPVWRAEKPQSGRYREFLQSDIDIFGAPPPISDSEIISTTNYILENLGFENFKIFINDRRVLFELMDYVSIPEKLHLPVISAIDKLDRKTKEEVRQELKNLSIKEKDIDHLYEHLDNAKPTKHLDEIISYLNSLGIKKDRLIFQARLARGLDYYTSTIFEAKIDQYKSGSVAGGGRYDDLIEKISGTSIPAVGIAFGFDRIIEALDQLKLFPDFENENKVLITVFNKELADKSGIVAGNLRDNQIPSEIYPNPNDPIKKQFKYADRKKIKWLIMIGPEEVGKNMVLLKNMISGHQEDVKLSNLVEKILEKENK